MRHAAGKVLILLTIALALANARCFAHCLVQPCGQQGAMSCHSHGKANSVNCAHHHDMTAPAASSNPAVDFVFVIPVAPADIALDVSLEAFEVVSPSPPERPGPISAPLRV